jgi:hypothetical protein
MTAFFFFQPFVLLYGCSLKRPSLTHQTFNQTRLKRSNYLYFLIFLIYYYCFFPKKIISTKDLSFLNEVVLVSFSAVSSPVTTLSSARTTQSLIPNMMQQPGVAGVGVPQPDQQQQQQYQQ